MRTGTASCGPTGDIENGRRRWREFFCSPPARRKYYKTPFSQIESISLKEFSRVLESPHAESSIWMEEDRWRQIDRIFYDLIEQKPEQRASLLDRLCADDPSLKKDVEELIQAYERSGSFLDSPAP